MKITSPINGENNSPYLLRMSNSVERPRIALKNGCLRLIPHAKSIKKRVVQNTKIKYLMGPFLKLLKLMSLCSPLIHRQECFRIIHDHGQRQLGRD